MTAAFLSRCLVLLAAVLAVAACGAGAAGGNGGPDRDAATRAEIEALFEARTDSARMRFTEADTRFMTGMIGHHAQALVMARLAPTHAASPSVRTLAARILNAQKDEIATMERWLRDRGQPVPDVEIDGITLRIDGAEHAMHMPGMLTPAQLRELDEARGADFDRLFLRRMIEHHRGAVVMVRGLFRVDGAGQDEDVFRFATDVHVDQTTEIARMERMLEAMAAEPPRP